MSEGIFRVSPLAIELAKRTGYTKHDELNRLHWADQIPMQVFLRESSAIADSRLSLTRPLVSTAVGRWVDEVSWSALRISDVAARTRCEDLIPIANEQGIEGRQLGFKLQELGEGALRHIIAAVYNGRVIFKQYPQGGDLAFTLPGPLDQIGQESNLTHLFCVETDNQPTTPASRISEGQLPKLARQSMQIARIRGFIGDPLKSATLYRIRPALPASNPEIEKFFLEQARSVYRIGRFYIGGRG